MTAPEQVELPAVVCLWYKALFEWHFGEIASSQATIAEAISLTKDLNDMDATRLDYPPMQEKRL
jgi:hypothetical protein